MKTDDDMRLGRLLPQLSLKSDCTCCTPTVDLKPNEWVNVYVDCTTEHVVFRCPLCATKVDTGPAQPLRKTSQVYCPACAVWFEAVKPPDLTKEAIELDTLLLMRPNRGKEPCMSVEDVELVT